MKKSELRKQVLQKMKNINNLNKEKADQWLKEQLLKTDAFRNAKTVGIVLSMEHEVNTFPIIKEIISQGKIPFVPATDYETKRMTFQRLNDLNQLNTDEKGIQYVDADTERTNSLDLLIVPGVVFNQEGYRIGYGGGYFDKFLNQHRTETISLVYDTQIDNTFKPEAHDEVVERLIIAKTS
ncbi:5-formyltetrahydrofolate cyclo-ligase [Staphylococcus simulans]|uniref:5-formyltetrahydrofolate cyclo-ligase n=1 Tax=Staphylococcus simulans TaxID=1286 RepID=UPI000D1EF79F|nr:5-formyltetrahydrofolate cyclo-ligase [Staphylococcus simulans]PTJ88114.1 5-formyltetrahydrofolate cyclo-ligase [Staphylococcus simulans]UXR31607.1 5-formyltetrahydrofolate cyclo-ligase [Staphylococcus simulans]UXV41306.1 5-formyltetrahydrofolate cyclo-ligase [Staphylococcus simulans]